MAVMAAMWSASSSVSAPGSMRQHQLPWPGYVNGIIRGGGDTAFSAKMNLISMWCIIVPFSAMAAFWWKCPPVAVFFLLKWDQLYKAIPVGIRLHSWKWVKKVTRA